MTDKNTEADDNKIFEQPDESVEETTEISAEETRLQPTWKKEPSIADLEQDLTDSSGEQDVHNQNVKRWLSNMYVTGAAKIPVVKGKSSIVPKLIRKQAEWRYASLSEPFLSTDDIFNVSPISAGDKKRAKQNELVLNNQFNTKIKKVKFIDDYVREAVDLGTVIVEVGWLNRTEIITEEQPVYEYIPDYTGQLAEQYMQLSQLRMEEPEQYADYSTPGLDQALDMFAQTQIAHYPKDTGETQEIKIEKETANHPTVEVSDSVNMVIDPSCNGDIDKAGFVCKKFKSSLSDLKKDGRYHNLHLVDPESASPFTQSDYDEPTPNEGFNFSDKARKQFVVHAYYGDWDIHGTGQTVPILASWVDRIMIRLEENPFPDRKPPFVTAAYMPKRKSIHGEPDGELLEDNQKIVGAVTRGIIDLLGKSANSQTGMRKDMLDVTNKRRFKAGEDYEFNSTVDARQGVHTHVYPEIPQSAYNVITMQNNEAESLTGIKAFSSSGISGDSLGSNVGSGRDALNAASKRETSILRRLAAGITDIGKKIIAMNAEFLSEEEVVRVTADDFVTVRRDDLAGNFDLRLTISTPEEDDAKAKELAFMLQTNGPNSDPAETRIIRAEIAELRKMPALAKRIREYQPQPDPMAVLKAELEIRLLEQQIAKEEALTYKHRTEAGVNEAREYKEGTQGDLNQAKAGTEGAKKRNLHSDSDNKDLGFVEQEAGVNQERELEKLDRQHENKVSSETKSKTGKDNRSSKSQ